MPCAARPAEPAHDFPDVLPDAKPRRKVPDEADVGIRSGGGAEDGSTAVPCRRRSPGRRAPSRRGSSCPARTSEPTGLPVVPGTPEQAELVVLDLEHEPEVLDPAVRGPARSGPVRRRGSSPRREAARTSSGRSCSGRSRGSSARGAGSGTSRPRCRASGRARRARIRRRRASGRRPSASRGPGRPAMASKARKMAISPAQMARLVPKWAASSPPGAGAGGRTARGWTARRAASGPGP